LNKRKEYGIREWLEWLKCYESGNITGEFGENRGGGGQKRIGQQL